MIFAALSATCLNAKTWTDTQGRTMEAEVVKVQDGQVYFKKDDGRQYTFPVSSLTEKDQAYLREHYPAVKTTGKPAGNKTPSELGSWLDGKLVARNGNRVSSDRDSGIKDADYIALYFSASWCPPCRKFTPKLVDFYNEQKKEHQNFEIVFVSSDRDDDSMEEYMVDYDMPWPAVKHSRAKDKAVRQYSGSGIPCLVLIDRNGDVVMHSYEGKEYKGPTRVMNKLAEVLNQPRSS